jgi:ubiquinone/menaquinone biosynthesis C-methylase UbiE
MATYDEIGIGYDETRKADPYITSRIIYNLRIVEGGLYLDVACGTGNYAIEMASRSKASFFGIDESEHMLQIAREKSQAIQWSLGDASSMPYEDNIFSGATCIFGVHHFRDLDVALNEVFRVLSRGRLVIFTSDKEQMEGYWLNEYFPEMMRTSIIKMPSIEEVSTALKTAGFRNIITELYKVKPDLQDCFLYCGKHKPQMYFDPVIRKGSSGFARFSNKDEVERGLERMSRDIANGKIDEVIESYENDKGDYAFIVAEKD